jgi:hypothetical protein
MACSDSELTPETMYPFRHFGRTLGQGISVMFYIFSGPRILFYMKVRFHCIENVMTHNDLNATILKYGRICKVNIYRHSQM